VVDLRGVIFQSDARSEVGAWFIRPFETLDRWVAGLRSVVGAPGAPGEDTLAIHAGLHVLLDDGREVVAEQLTGTPYEDLRSGLNWTPLERFRARDRGGWDVTVPPTAFRGVDQAAVEAAVEHLNHVEGHPFLGEDCIEFVERVFGGQRLFAASPTLLALGLRMGLGDPAMPLLRPDAPLDDRARRLLRAETLAALPAPAAALPAEAVWRWRWRLLGAAAPALVVLAAAFVGWRLSVRGKRVRFSRRLA
jgi:hypothetical protein